MFNVKKQAHAMSNATLLQGTFSISDVDRNETLRTASSV